MSIYNVTSTNSTATVTIETLFPAGFIVEGYATDQAVSAEAEDITEIRIGVDGKLAAGFVPNAKTLGISLEPNSPSEQYFWQLADAMRANKTIYIVTIVVVVPSIQTSFKYINGVLKSCPTGPSIKRTLEPTTWSFQFEDIQRSKVSGA
jgi:hypothetical protein